MRPQNAQSTEDRGGCCKTRSFYICSKDVVHVRFFFFNVQQKFHTTCISPSSHVDIDKISKLSADTESSLSRNLNAAGDQLLDSLIVNNFGSVSAHTYVEKQDNIVQARSLELEQQQFKHGEAQPSNKCFVETAADSLPTSITSVGPKPTSAPIVEGADECLLAQLVGSFSWQRNLNRLFEGGGCTSDVDDIEDDVRIVSGLKVLCSLAIMLVHVCVFLLHVSSEYANNKFNHHFLNASLISGNKRFASDSPIVSTIIANGSVTIDVFFFLRFGKH